MSSIENENKVILGLNITEERFSFTSSIESAITNVKDELADLQETIASVQKMKSDCDKRDYALAASSGVLCGIVNIFLVGKPGESPFGDITDKWFSDHTIDFAKFCGWDGKDNGALFSAINFLEKKFKIPYDQRGAGDAGSIIFDLIRSTIILSLWDIIQLYWGCFSQYLISLQPRIKHILFPAEN